MVIKKVLNLMGRDKKPKTLFKEIHKCLDLFISLEAQLWGIKLNKLTHEQELALEDINHLIYKFQHSNHSGMKKYLKSKEFEHTISEIILIYEDFKDLKKQINRKEIFKNTLNSLTLLLMNEETYQLFEDLFLLEKQLQEVLLWQEEEFKELFKNSKELKHLTEDERVEHLYDNIRVIREILAGNLDHHGLWENEMQGYSNCSNILHSIKARVLKLEKVYFST